MNADQHHSDELTGALKRAVDEVKGLEPPAASLAQSVDRASRLARPAVSRRRRIIAVMAASSVAATMLMGIALWADYATKERDLRAMTAGVRIMEDDNDSGGDLAAVTNLLPDDATPLPTPNAPFERFGGAMFGGTHAPKGALPGAPPGFDPARRGSGAAFGAPDRPAMPPPATWGTGRGVGGGGEGRGTRTPVTADALSQLGVIVQSGTEVERLEELKARIRKDMAERSRTELKPGSPDGAVSPLDLIGIPRKADGKPDRLDHPNSPQNDSFAGNGSGPGKVDPTKLKKFSETWGNLPEKERAKAMEELLRRLPPKHREVVENYFRSLGMKLPAPVWTQKPRPTFARVYVGDGNALELVSLHVTVTVEGSRARTLVDHVFRNPHDRRLEGTFEYPLPSGASPSYFAMFLGQTRDAMPPLFSRRGDAPPLPQEALASLAPDQLVKHVSSGDWGKLQEARVVSKDKGLETYEEVTRQRVDPALLEYAGGNTFRGRVFPIPPHGYNRVLIAYEEQLPFVGDQVRYRFPLPEAKLSEMAFTLTASAAECKDPKFQASGGRQLPCDSICGPTPPLVYSQTWHNEVKGGDAVFSFTPPNPSIQAISGRQGESGPLYLQARIRPDLKVTKAQPFAHHAVFLLDTSLSENPDRFDRNMKLLRAILEADADIEKFNVLTFNVGTAWVEPNGWIDNTAAGRDKVFKRLDGLVLEGATDFGAALDALAGAEPWRGQETTPQQGGQETTPQQGNRPPQQGKKALWRGLLTTPRLGLLWRGLLTTPHPTAEVFVLSDGQITWGDTDATALVAGFEARCPCRTRFHCYRTGLGAENLELYAALTRKGGGVYNCFTPDAVAAAAKAHRSQCLQVDSVKIVGGPGASDLLVAGRQAAVYPGGDLVVAARVKEPGKAQVVVEGTFNGAKFAQEYPVEIHGDSELAPRGWGEVAVASLLALNDPKLDGLATAYCQQFGIGSRAASFLILENENDYKRFNLEEERGKTLAGDLAKYLDAAWATLGKPASAREQFVRFLKQVDGRTHLLDGANGKHVAKLLALLKDADFELPAAPIAGALLHKSDVPPQYLALRDNDPREVSTYITEAKRRAAGGDADGAVRVLSSVIEEHPGRGDALRLVGYRLLDLKMATQAARLFRQVQKQRPFEPHSYRDLGRSLEESGKYGLAAIQYEIVLAGTWHNRFKDSLKQVAREEYASLMREAIRKQAVGKDLADLFGERLEGLAADTKTSDLRVTMSWNTDDTDIDLWVIEPDGEKCYYQHRQTKLGGELSDDMTQGYGPERYRTATMAKGTYRVMVHYFRANPNLLAGETHVNVVVTRHAGTPQETTERHTVILKTQGEAVEVTRVEN